MNGTSQWLVESTLDVLKTPHMVWETSSPGQPGQRYILWRQGHDEWPCMFSRLLPSLYVRVSRERSMYDAEQRRERDRRRDPRRERIFVLYIFRWSGIAYSSWMYPTRDRKPCISLVFALIKSHWVFYANKLQLASPQWIRDRNCLFFNHLQIKPGQSIIDNDITDLHMYWKNWTADWILRVDCKRIHS